MITLRRATMRVESGRARRTILDNVSATLPRGRTIGVLCDERSGATSLLRLFAGAEHLDAGSLRVDASVSWPIGRRGSYFGPMSSRDAATFVARLYGDDPRRVVSFMSAFSGIGRSIDESLKRCSADMKTRVQLSLALSIDFDCYLIDGFVLSGNPEYQQKCWEVLLDKRDKGASLVVACGSPRQVLDHCDTVAVLANGSLIIYDDVVEGVREFRDRIRGTSAIRAMNVEGHRP